MNSLLAFTALYYLVKVKVAYIMIPTRILCAVDHSITWIEMSPVKCRRLAAQDLEYLIHMKVAAITKMPLRLLYTVIYPQHIICTQISNPVR